MQLKNLSRLINNTHELILNLIGLIEKRNSSTEIYFLFSQQKQDIRYEVFFSINNGEERVYFLSLSLVLLLLYRAIEGNKRKQKYHCINQVLLP